MIFTIQQDPDDCRCSACGSREVISRGHAERQFLSLPIGSRKTTVVLPIPRVECRACGVVRQVKVPFADPRRSYTKSFERYVLELSRSMTIRDVAHHLDVGWDLVKDIQKRDLSRRYAKPKLKHLRRHRHRRDRRRQGAPLPDGGHGPGERRRGLRRRRQGGRRVEALLEAAAAQRGQDRGGGHGHVGGVPGGGPTHLPKAKIVFDHFHVIKLFNEKLSDLRRALYREATDVQHKEVLKGTRWLLLKNAENLDEEKDEKSG